MPNTIEQNLQRLVTAKQNIANAITSKGGTVGANDGFEEFPTAIGTIPSDMNNGSFQDDVSFIDYDGTVVASYTKEEFLQLNELPSNPSHSGLTAQGWNWSLSDAKNYMSANTKLIIGQMYTTSDGKTRIYVSMPEGRVSPTLNLYLEANSEVDIDWGDNSTHSTITSTSADYKTETHNYSTYGDYIIQITVVSGSAKIEGSLPVGFFYGGYKSSFSPDRAYLNCVTEVNIGSNMTLGSVAFRYCGALKYVSIPSWVTSIGGYTFDGCSSLYSICFPSGLTSMGVSAFTGCNALSVISFPKGLSLLNELSFDACGSLLCVSIPDGLSTIGNFSFEGCVALSYVCVPEGVTALGESVFRSCASLSSITLPSTLTSIDDSCFKNTAFMEFIKFKSDVPPTVVNSNAFDGWDSSVTTIYCPTEYLQDYKSAQNYPDPSSFNYVGF